MEAIDNLSSSATTFSSGFNATAYLQPGENQLELGTVPSGAYEDDFTYRADDTCQVTLYGAFPDGTKKEISNLTATVEDGKPTIKDSTTYPANHQSPLVNVDGTLDGHLTMFSRPIHIKTLPRWRWVDATPFDENNPKHMKMLRRAYSHLITLLEKRDFEGLKMAWSLSNREKAKAEAYMTEPDEFFDVMDLPGDFERASDVQAEPRREWHEYSLKSLMDGRLVRLEDQRGMSPIRYGSDELDLITSLDPYFAIIDGRMVIAR
ncbi:glycosyl hydrolase family 26 [Salinivibrio kushneri]|uniref:Glycosyl hydrolase family 26 n=1 Tax=Salinivibrio kushneri TaxID=1908198 RepID=A0AB36KBM7_9GAMM|nr:glycosyl hydrolase family 26 [Salinivibrio kushneri]OOE46008.1 glycosyl hydrolase family 26 [Salinivibrio kushneri]OOE47945.1 glycosyl hydrolase family 26 [Salinivibrio kushneri]